MVFIALLWALSLAYFNEKKNYCLHEIYGIYSSSAICCKTKGIDNSVNDRLGFVNLNLLEKLSSANKKKPALDWGKQQTGI